MARSRQRHNPFRGLMDVTSEMARMSDQMYGVDTKAETQPRSHVDAWTPTADVFARGEDLVVRVELPGVDYDELEVTYSNGTLTISGERRADEDAQTVYYTKERSWGHFRRGMTLPEGVTNDDITADFGDGLLEVVIRGGATATTPMKIEVGDRRRRKR